MSVSLQDLEREARRLPPEERESLINSLITTLDDELLTDVDKAWLEEVERRRLELRAGKIVGIPASDVFDSIRQELGWNR